MGLASLLRMFTRRPAQKTMARPASAGFPGMVSGLNPGEPIGLIAGNGAFPGLFIDAAHKHGHRVIAVCHKDETLPEAAAAADQAVWIKVGEIGRLIATFTDAGVRRAVMAGGISRVRLFGGVKLDLRGAALLARLRSTKDDVIMRGLADELARDGVEVISCATFMEDSLAVEGVLTATQPTEEEWRDVRVGIDALRAMSAQDIGQLVVVREGVIVAVEAVEGSDAAIRRGGSLGGKGTVVVKFSKPTQDLRFDMPTIGKRTIDSLVEVQARVLAVESGRCLILEQEAVLAHADRCRIAVVGCKPLERIDRGDIYGPDGSDSQPSA